MGKEVKNLLRAQSKYGLMGSHAKTGKKFVGVSQEHFLHKSAIWDRTPLHLHIKCSLYVCRRVHISQIFKWNSIISICSKVIAFFMISLSPHGSCGPHVVPVIPIVPRRSPCGPHTPHGCGLHCLHPMWSPHLWSPCCPRHRHIIPTSSRRSPHHQQLPRYPPPTPWGVGALNQ